MEEIYDSKRQYSCVIINRAKRVAVVCREGGILVRQLIQRLKDCIAIVILSVVLLAALLTAGGYQTYQRALAERPVGNVIKEIYAKPSYVCLSEVPQIYKEAVLAVEDPRFYKHNGIDFIAIVEALWRDLKERRLAAGGSTITQQLCKNQFFTQKKLFTRKIAEVFMVREIENSYTKNEILELYINSIYYGNGYYSLADAGAGYFGKTVAELNAWECTLLAGLPNAPSAYAPNKHPELALQRQSQVLNAMVKYDFITQKQAKEILQQCPENFL